MGSHNKSNPPKPMTRESRETITSCYKQRSSNSKVLEVHDIRHSQARQALVLLGKRRVQPTVWCREPLDCTGREHSLSCGTFGRKYIASPGTKDLAGSFSGHSTTTDRSMHRGQITWSQLSSVPQHKLQATAFLGLNGTRHSTARLYSRGGSRPTSCRAF